MGQGQPFVHMALYGFGVYMGLSGLYIYIICLYIYMIIYGLCGLYYIYGSKCQNTAGLAYCNQAWLAGEFPFCQFSQLEISIYSGFPLQC